MVGMPGSPGGEASVGQVALGHVWPMLVYSVLLFMLRYSVVKYCYLSPPTENVNDFCLYISRHSL